MNGTTTKTTAMMTMDGTSVTYAVSIVVKTLMAVANCMAVLFVIAVSIVLSTLQSEFNNVITK
jgi:hypothetical protein